MKVCLSGMEGIAVYRIGIRLLRCVGVGALAQYRAPRHASPVTPGSWPNTGGNDGTVGERRRSRRSRINIEGDQVMRALRKSNPCGRVSVVGSPALRSKPKRKLLGALTVSGRVTHGFPYWGETRDNGQAHYTGYLRTYGGWYRKLSQGFLCLRPYPFPWTPVVMQVGGSES